MPSAVDLAVLRILRPHFRIQDGASLVSAEGLEALATLSPRDEAGQPRADDAEEEGGGSTCGPTRLATPFSSRAVRSGDPSHCLVANRYGLDRT